MMNKPNLYGISNCDSVKKARRWLDEHGIAYHFHDFRQEGLANDDLQAWLDTLGWEALLNKRSTTWRNLDDAEKSGIDADSAKALMLREPTLIKRPVLVHGEQVLSGFSEQAYGSTLNE